MTTAFVLSGGGSLGAMQVGMLRTLLRNGIEPDRIYGTSIGALNGGHASLQIANVSIMHLETRPLLGGHIAFDVV